MIKRVIYRIDSINEILFYYPFISLFSTTSLQSFSAVRNKMEGHRSAKILLLGGKFINFAYVSLITSACLNKAGTANNRCYGILQN